MTKLPAVTKHGAAVARVAVPAGLAFVAAMFPAAAGVVGVATPFLLETVKRREEKAASLLEGALREGDVIDLSGEEVEAFVPMAYRFFEAARQGEFDRNLRLLAAFLVDEIKSDPCQPGSFLDMAKRLEALSIPSLRAVAMIDQLRRSAEEQGRPRNAGFGFSVSQFISGEKHALPPFAVAEAMDVLADLSGRGFLFASSHSEYGGSEQHFTVTQPLHLLLQRARKVAQEEASRRHPA